MPQASAAEALDDRGPRYRALPTLRPRQHLPVTVLRQGNIGV